MSFFRFLYILSPRIVKKYTTSLRIEMSLCLWINCKMWMTTWWPRFLVYCICFFEIYIYTQNRILVTKLYLGILNNYMYWCFLGRLRDDDLNVSTLEVEI